MQPSYVTFSMCLRAYMFALDKITASDWLSRQFLAVVLALQQEVVCICTVQCTVHVFGAITMKLVQ